MTPPRRLAEPPRILNEGASELVDIDAVTLHPDNPNQGDLGKLIESIQVNGWYGVLYAQRSTGYVLAGNHRLAAAQHLGMPQVPVVWLDVDDRRAAKILLVDNAGARAGTWDDSSLAQMLSMLATDSEGLHGTGFDGDDLDDLLKLLEQDAPAPRERSKSYNVTVKCSNEDEQRAVLQQLVTLGLDARAK